MNTYLIKTEDRLMTTASLNNFFVSEYDQEMHTISKVEADARAARKHTEIEYAIEAIERAKETLVELQYCNDRHAIPSIVQSALAKIKDAETLIARMGSRN